MLMNCVEQWVYHTNIQAPLHAQPLGEVAGVPYECTRVLLAALMPASFTPSGVDQPLSEPVSKSPFTMRLPLCPAERERRERSRVARSRAGRRKDMAAGAELTSVADTDENEV